MGAGFSVCHCNSSHATSPGKTTLQSLNQPDRSKTTSNGGIESFFATGNSLKKPTASPKSCAPKRNGTYKPQKVLSDSSLQSRVIEDNNNADPKALSKEKQEKFCTTSPEPTSSDSALVLDMTEDNTESRVDSSGVEDKVPLPSQAQRPKSAAPTRNSRRSGRTQKSFRDTQTLEVEDLERVSEDLDQVPPFRRFRPKSARDPRRRSNRVMDIRTQSSSLSRSLSMPSRKVLKLKLKRSDGESSDLSEDISDCTDSGDDEDGFSSDTLSIPDETDPNHGSTVTTITVRPKLGNNSLGQRKASRPAEKQRAQDSEIKGGIWERSSPPKSASTAATVSKDNNNNNRAKSSICRLHSLNGVNETNENDNEDDSNNYSHTTTNLFSSSYHGSGYGDEGAVGGGFSKKASERSISGVILLTPCELPDFDPTLALSTSTSPKSSLARVFPSPLQSPAPTPRTPATIKLTPVAQTSPSSPAPSICSQSSPKNPTNHRKSQSNPPSSLHRSPPPSPHSVQRQHSLSTPAYLSDSNCVCSACLRILPAASITITDSSLEACACGNPRTTMNKDVRASQQAVLTDLEHKATRKREPSCKTIASRPDSGIAGSSSASYASSEAALLEGRHGSQADLIASSLEMLEHVYQVRPEGHPTVTSLVKALTVNCHSAQAKAHALYRWLSGQSLVYYKCMSCSNPSSPTSKMKQLAESKTTYAAVYQEMARCAGLRCELIEGHVKGVKYSPGSPALCQATKHAWNAVSLNGHYALLDAQMGSLPHKFFLEHFFMTPPDEFCLSHYPKDKRWLLMTRAISEEDFFGALKTWPTMFAFNIRPLSMRSVIRTYDGRLSVTVLLHSVAVTPVLEYTGPGVALDGDALTLGIDQEIRNTDNAETFHMCLPQEGDYFFTLMVHDVEEDEDIPVFQYKIEYKDELL